MGGPTPVSSSAEYLQQVTAHAARLGQGSDQPAGSSSPDLLGIAHQALQERDARRRAGAFYTPAPVALRLARLVLEDLDRAVRVCDPACGGGAFLLAAGRVLESRGLSRRHIVEDLLWGVDLDPRSLAVAELALVRWAAEAGERVERTNLAVADGLCRGLDAWPGSAEPFDAVLGNPPFQSQLASRTARTAEQAAALRQRLGDVASGYADSSSLFLATAVELVRDGGRVALVMPESFLAARDARPARRYVLRHAALRGLWLAEGAVFDASVRVCAPVLERRPRGGQRPDEPIRRWVGTAMEPVDPAPIPLGALDTAPTWSGLIADRRGVPPVELDTPGRGRLGDLARATAGFRAQYYGIGPHVVDAGVGASGPPAEGLAPLVTAGAIDPLRCLWGQRPVRFAGQRWTAPVVDLEALRRADPDLARWADSVLVPKVVVATQTRVLEAAVDETGGWWPSVPVVAVTADPEDLWAVAAILLAPPVSAWAMARVAGAALSADAVKLAAREVLEIPLPSRRRPWERAAALLRDGAAAASVGDGSRWRALLVRAGAVMTEAYGAGERCLAWWEARLPPFR
ncbi:HsdM family class I SAM-dependent methyltransferase [Rhabdothermincola sediminis]|uniref:HsdM family class I SAM-dependent methyltransferase n=1 Tax=Rhabdothermincola sediminis TaxID=2751370 RepID=UPI001AA08055|nr:N-6 DNA methylase [Rhabdothermincola sediminis]